MNNLNWLILDMYLKHLIHNKTEKWFLLIFIVLFLIVLTANLRPPISSAVTSPIFRELLTADITATLINNIGCSIIAAYIFYLVLESYPTFIKRKHSKDLLNQLINTVLYSYDKCDIFGHEQDISSLDPDAYSLSWLNEAEKKLTNKNFDNSALKQAMFAAQTRLHHFNNCLQLANQLSPKYAALWLDISDKIRLLSECNNKLGEPYDSTFSDTEKEKHLIETIAQRLFEFIKKVEAWKKFSPL